MGQEHNLSVHQISRRGALGAFAATPLVGAPGLATAPRLGQARSRERFFKGADPRFSGPPGEQAPVSEGFFKVPGGKLWYWDTGGTGEPWVLMHPGTGSAMSWPYQQPVLARAGYRVIAFSQRGAFRSETDPGSSETRLGDDLACCVDALSLKRFHLLGAAAGAFSAVQYAVLNRERVRSLTIVGSMMGLSEAEHLARVRGLTPPDFHSMPPEFRELSPSYRVANANGVALWLAVHAGAKPATTPHPPQAGPTFHDLRSLLLPVHLIFGDADLYSPPALARPLLDVFPDARLSVIGETGHAPFWEQPEVFNRALLSAHIRPRAAKRP